MMMTLSTHAPMCAVRPHTASRGRAPRRMVTRIPSFSGDPQKAKEDKEARHKNNPIWQEPSNKNPLEKTTFTRESPIGSETSSDENPIREITEEISSNANAAVESVKEGIESASQAVKDKIDEARGKA